MTLHPSLSVSPRVSGPYAVTVAVGGELDYDSGDTFLTVVTSALDAHARDHGPTLRDLRLDCADLVLIDSLGLSMLLMLRRRTSALGVTLHLENQPACLTRMLHITGTADHLTGNRRSAPPLSGERTE